MKKYPIFFFLIAFIAIGNSAFVYAHDMYGNLGPDSSASDYFQVHCYDNGEGGGDAKLLEIELLTTTKAVPVVSLQVSTELPITIKNITDPVSGDSNFSRTIEAANIQSDHTANGYYYISVNKTKYGIQSYHFTYHCMGNGHAGTELIGDAPLQNQ